MQYCFVILVFATGLVLTGSIFCGLLGIDSICRVGVTVYTYIDRTGDRMRAGRPAS